MKTHARLFTAALCALMLLCAVARAQTPERRPALTTTPQTQEPSTVVNSADPMTNELGLLRKALQTLNTRLRDISEKLLGGDAAQTDAVTSKQGRLAQSLEILSRAEQRAELMRRQLLDLTEKEIWFRNRLVQLDEDLRPESIERSITVGTTRTPELRDVRRRVLDNERKGVENLYNQTAQNRARLEEDLKLADLLVARLRARLLPLIEKEIDKLPTNPGSN